MKKDISHTSLLAVGAAVLLLVLFGAGKQVAAQTESGIVAVVNGKTIGQQDIDNAAFSQIFPLQEQIYALRKIALENLILRALLEDEARKRGVSIEELKKQLMIGQINISASEVEREYLQNASAFGAMSPDEAKERIRLSIESEERIRLYREALNDLRKRARTEILLSEPRLPLTRELGSSPAIGLKDAPILIVEFTDFQCPFCRESTEMIKRILKVYSREVILVFKHLPLHVHENAFDASRAAFCAGQQNSFWQYHNALFASRDLSAEALNRIASNLKLDLQKFKDCVSSEISRVAVLKDMDQAKRLGINSTPTFIINGRLVRGSIVFDKFKSIVEDELKLAAPHSRAEVNMPRKD